MALVNCKECKQEISTKAQECPHCGVKSKPKLYKYLIYITLVFTSFLYIFGGGMDKQVATNMQNITNKVAKDAEVQYQMAKRSGSLIDICVQAGLVSAAYLQAQNELRYEQWKQREQTDCAQAGISQ